MKAMSESDWVERLAAWRALRGVGAREIDLARIGAIRQAPLARLSDPRELASMIAELGLNDEGLDEFPPCLHPACGHGLRIWQYPCQFAPYLVELSGRCVRSYLELGVRHGGSFVASTEFLGRFQPLSVALAVDILPAPALSRYRAMNPIARFERIDTLSDGFEHLLSELGPFDLAFVDSHHHEAQCRAEFERLRPHARMIALHDIHNRRCPGVGKVWREILASGGHHCLEFVGQYADTAGQGPFMGIGLAIATDDAGGRSAAGRSVASTRT